MNDLSVEKKMRFALAGNPNCGKSTFFNLMTGQQRPVGNLSGVTVEKYVGTVKKGVSQKNIELCDLPGMYSADPLGAEERIAAEELKSGAYDCIINIIDGTNLERQLYLTLQLRMTGKPMVVGVNMADILKEQGIYIDYKKLGRLLGNVEVLPISAKRGTGTKELICAAEKACKIKNDSLPDFVSADFQNADLYDIIDKVLTQVSGNVKSRTNQQGFYADKIFLHPAFGYISMILIIAVIFILTFGAPGKVCGELFGKILEYLSAAAEQAADKMHLAVWLKSLVTDGILAGVFGVLGFLPQLTILYIALAVLEDSGIMARFSFLADPLLRRIGVSGKAAIPFIMAFGCTVPALTSARIIDTARERLTALCIIPFIACSARIPIYFYICEKFFPDLILPITVMLYLPGVIFAAAAGAVLKKGFGKAYEKDLQPPFVLELPQYRLPNVKSMSVKVWVKLKHFMTKAATVIVLLSIVLWFLQNFSLSFVYLSGQAEESILALFGNLIAPIFRPIGFGCGEAAVSLLTGIAAKEAVVSSLSVFVGSGFDITAEISRAGAAAFLCFTAMYTPCIAAVAALRQELGGVKRTAVLLILQFAAAYAASGIVYLIANIFI